MNVTTWVAGLWPVAIGAVLLLVVAPKTGIESSDSATPSTIEAPLPAKDSGILAGVYRPGANPGAIRLCGGSGADTFRAVSSQFAADFDVGDNSAEGLSVTIELASMVPAADDPGPKESFASRLGSALGAQANGAVRMELRCVDASPANAGSAHRSRCSGVISVGPFRRDVEFFLWHCGVDQSSLQAMGSVACADTSRSTSQPPLPWWSAPPGMLTIGLDLRLRIAP